MTKRRYAALTMVRDENPFLKIWHRYYAHEFGAENLFIIDHNSQTTPPGNVIGQQSNILRLPFDNPTADLDAAKRRFDDARFKFISAQITSLLHYYDCVVFNDVDEVFIPDTPSGIGLQSYLDSLPEIGIRAGMGIEIFQDTDNETAYNPDISLFKQRKYFRYRLNFCKPWIIGTPVEITGHGVFSPFHIDPNLLLIHLHWIDQGLLYERRTQRLNDFEQGRGGLKSRWKDDIAKAGNMLHSVAKTPISPEEMPHPDLLEALFPNYRDQAFSSLHYKRHFGQRKRLHEVEKFVSEKDKLAIANKRYQFPKRFEDKEL